LQIADFFSSECTDVVCRLALPGPAGKAYSAPPDPLAAFDGPTSKRGEGKGVEEKGGKKRGDATHPIWNVSSYATALPVVRFVRFSK